MKIREKIVEGVKCAEIVISPPVGEIEANFHCLLELDSNAAIAPFSVKRKKFLHFDDAECIFSLEPSGLIRFEYILPLHEEMHLADLLSEPLIAKLVGSFSPHNPDIFHCECRDEFVKDDTLDRWAKVCRNSRTLNELKSIGITSITECFEIAPFPE